MKKLALKDEFIRDTVVFKTDEYLLPVSLSTLARGDEIKRSGIAGMGKVVTISEDLATVVIAWKGYSENPGSRYSGLYSYYPATTEVFVYVGTDESGSNRYLSLIEWKTRPEKKEEKNETKKGRKDMNAKQAVKMARKIRKLVVVGKEDFFDVLKTYTKNMSKEDKYKLEDLYYAMLAKGEFKDIK